MSTKTIKIDILCEQKKIIVTWNVTILGVRSRIQEDNLGKKFDPVDAVKKQFEKSFNRNGKYFKIGTCVVIFKFKVKVERGRDWFKKDLKPKDRDVIIIDEPIKGGGGFAVPGWKKRSGVILIHPYPDGTFSEFKLENELGHGLGLKDRGRGARGEWNHPKGVKPLHIRKALRSITSAAERKKIERCCGTDIMQTPGMHISVAKEKPKGRRKSGGRKSSKSTKPRLRSEITKEKKRGRKRGE